MGIHNKMNSILSKQVGTFVFLLKNNEIGTYTNFKDVPKSSEIKEIIKFLPEIPPAPHSIQQHEEIHLWQKTFERLMGEIYASRN